MMNNFREVTATDVTVKQGVAATSVPGKLFVAYVNREMNEPKEINEGPGNNLSTRQRASVLSTSGGKYYINGIPILMTQENDAGIYDEELSGYF